MARMKLKGARPPRDNIQRKLGSSGGRKKSHIKRLKSRHRRKQSTGGPVGKV